MPSVEEMLNQMNDWRNLISEQELTLLAMLSTTPSVANIKTERGLFGRIVNLKGGGRVLRVDIPLSGKTGDIPEDED